jgi:hypothetical protein
MVELDVFLLIHARKFFQGVWFILLRVLIVDA